VVSLVVAESLSASGLGYNRTYNAQENTSASLQLNHRFTGKLHSSVNASFVNSTFTAELLTPQLQIKNTTPSDQAITAHWGIGYDFQKWLSTELDYDYTKLLSSEPELVAPYDRDQVTIRLILTY
jgi:predicted porin